MSWGFLYQNPRDITLWRLVYKYSPYLQDKRFRDICNLIEKRYLPYKIIVPVGSSKKISYAKKQQWEIVLIAKQRLVLSKWMRFDINHLNLARRTGKTTLIAKMVQCIPEDLVVVVFVIGIRTKYMMHNVLGHERRNLLIFTVREENVFLQRLQSIRYDFCFIEHVDNEKIVTVTPCNPFARILSLYSK